jgi:radical SAM protein with 4Fe4S-binding SPASM domain
MRYLHTVERLVVDRPPLVVVPQFFGSTVFDRRSSRFLPFDHEATALLLALRDKSFDAVHAEWRAHEPDERVHALERFFEHFDGRGFFTVDGRLAGEPLPVTPPDDHLVGPLAAHLEVVSACNLTCKHCFAGDLPRREGQLTRDELDRLFADMAAVGTFRLGLTGGEPLLRRDLFDIIDLATNHGLCPCVTTNGLLVTDEVARAFGERELVWLNVSLDGATAESNDRVRGEGSFDRVLERLEVLRRHATFTLAFTIMSHNAGEVEDCVRLAERVGASTAVFRPMYPVGVGERHLDLMPTFDQYSDALARLETSSIDGSFAVRPIDPFGPSTRMAGQSIVHTNHGCGAGNLVCSISVSGEINPCGFLGPGFVAGNVRDSSLSELWHHSEGFQGIRALPGGNPCGGGDTDGFSGGCRARALVLNGSVDAPDPWLVEGKGRLLPLTTLELRR